MLVCNLRSLRDLNRELGLLLNMGCYHLNDWRFNRCEYLRSPIDNYLYRQRLSVLHHPAVPKIRVTGRFPY